MLAAIWVVVKHLDAGFRSRICSAMFVRVNFAVAGFKSLPIDHGFGSLKACRMPVPGTDIASVSTAEKKACQAG